MAFASVSELRAQLDFELDEQGFANASSKLDQASHYARFYSGVDWQDDDNVPGVVKSIVLNVVERYMRNPEGYVQSRSGDETVAWTDKGERSSLYFTDAEIAILASFGNAGFGIGSFGTYAWGNTKCLPHTLHVPADYSPDWPFPLYAGSDPWVEKYS